jgi:hypothetical protein
MVLENPKSKTARQLNCQNQEKTACCYLCTNKKICQINCKYLGNAENTTFQVGTQKNEKETEFKEKPEAAQTTNSEDASCLFCSAEMARYKTKFKIEGLNSDLSATIFVCPKCGKIEFKADEKLKAS